MSTDQSSLSGQVTWELRGPDGELKRSGTVKNLITDTGDQLYASRGCGLTTTAVPTGMKLGTGSTAVAKNGAGAALTTYLSNSHQAFDATYPSAVDSAGNGSTVTYKVTYAAGKATSASAITEAVIVIDALADATSTAANTAARVLLTGIGSKGSSDTLTVTWTHLLKGT
jgi:hypothetical protein